MNINSIGSGARPYDPQNAGRLFLLCVTGGSGAKDFDVKITIPAGSIDTFVYPQEEISPSGNSIRLPCGEGLGDTEVILKLINAIGEYSLAACLMPKVPVKIDTAKGECKNGTI